MAKTKKPKKSRRYCFVSDDDGHHYLIPLSKRDLWFTLDGAYCNARTLREEEDALDAFEEAFGKYRCGSVWDYSFESPESLG